MMSMITAYDNIVETGDVRMIQLALAQDSKAEYEGKPMDLKDRC